MRSFMAGSAKLMRLLRTFYPSLLLLSLLLSSPSAAMAQEFTVYSSSTTGNVTVMEVSGVDGTNYNSSYDAAPNGVFNAAPRNKIVQEFYKAHNNRKDEYDFVVIFTNYDFGMLKPGVLAYYSPIRNNVYGIGAPVADYTVGVGADYYGVTARQIQGLIEMGNLANRGSDPLDPKFEETLQILTHEMMHRWGAFIGYKPNLTGPLSQALLGIDNSHWSYLLDTNGSLLYGSHWRDNGDGTFTSIEPANRSLSGFGRIYAPLDLYLMGFIDKTQVPPMMLIDNPDIDKNQLPRIGDMVSGTATTVTIDEIVAAMGERNPNAALTSKSLRMGFIYAVAPGTANAANLRGIEAIANEMKTRFMVLTDGKGSMEVSPSPDATTLPVNPGYDPLTPDPINQPSIDAGVSWLMGQQYADGRWQDQTTTVLRDTAEAVLSLKPFASAQTNYQNGLAWLDTASAESTDYLSRKIAAKAGAVQDVSALVTELVSRQNIDGGWGSKAGYASNGLDTGLALKALATAGYTDSGVISGAISFLSAVHNSGGGWSSNSHKDASPSAVQSTAMILSALNAYRHSYSLEVQIAAGMAWLTGRQNGDGGFGNSDSTVYDTALAVLALRDTGASQSVTNAGLQFLRSQQRTGGSWNASAYQTALSVEALYKGEIAADLAVMAADVTFNPNKVTTPVPANVEITATVRNLGSTNVASTRVVLYEGEPFTGILRGTQDIAVNGNTAVPVTFTVTASADGLVQYSVVVDPDNLVQEASDWNNSATKYLNVNVALPVVGFETGTSSASESAGTASVNVVMSKTWPEPVTVTYSVNPASTAAAVTDYQLNNGTIIFNPGETAKSITITLVNDSFAEYNETVVLDLSNPLNAETGQGSHTLTITDDGDLVPSVKILSPTAGTIGTRTPLLQYIAAPASATVTVTVDTVAVGKVSGEYLDSLADGTHTVRVEATDGINTGSDTVTFIVDANPPVVTMKSPVEGVYSNNQPLLVYSVNKTATVTVKVDGSAVPLPDGSPLPSGSTLPALADGGHTVKVEAIDAAGTLGFAEAYFVVSPAPESAYVNIWPQMTINNQKQTGGVATDVFGNVYTVGVIESGFTDGTYSIAKYDPRGNLLWSHTGGSSTSSIYVEDIAVDSEGSAYFVAYTSGTFNGYSNVDYDDSYLVKYDTDGNYKWTEQIGQYGYQPDCNPYDPNPLCATDQVYSVAVGKNDTIYVAGVTGGPLYGYSSADWSLFLAHYTKDGLSYGGMQIGISNESYGFGSGSVFHDFCDLAVDSEGNVYIGARTEMNMATSDRDYLIVKYGVEDFWTMTDGTTSYDATYGIAVDSLGNAYLTGTFTAKYDPAGALVIPAQAGGGYAIAAERNGNIFTTGAGFVRKADNVLSPRWSWSMLNGTGRGIALDENGDVLVASNNGTSTYLYKLHDTRLPSVALDHWSFKTNSVTPTITGTREEGAQVTVIPNGSVAAGPVTHPTPTTWQCILGGLAEGANTIAVVAKNDAGFKYKVYGEIILDTVPPVVTLTSPVSGQDYTVKPDLIYSVSGGTARITVNGIEIQKESGHYLDCLRNGINTVRVEGVDEAGNIAFAEATFTVGSGAVGELPFEKALTRQAGTTANDTVYDMAKDQMGNIYLAGSTSGLFDTNTTSLSPDAFVIKYDNAGNRTTPAWQFDTGNSDEANGIALDSAKNVYLVQTEYFAQEGNKGWSEILVSIYNENKVLQWEKEVGSSSTDYAKDIAVDNTGNVIVTGYTYGKFENASYGNDGYPDYFVAKINGSSNHGVMWKYQSGVTGYEVATAVAVDASNNVYVTGNKGGPFVTKINSSGSFAWEKPIIAGTGSGYGLAVDGNGYIYVVGTVNTSNGNGNDMFLAKYDQAGTQVWTPVILGSAGDDVGRDLALDAAGNVYVGGYTSGNFDGNISLGSYDLFVVKFNSAGQKLWSGQWGTISYDILSGIELDSGNIILGGYTTGGMEGSNAGGYDAFIMKLSAPAELPAIAITGYSPSQTESENGSSQTLSGTMGAGTVVTVSASTGATVGEVTTNPDGTWTCTVSNLIHGNNIIYARATDNSGRFGTASATINYIDDVPPSVVITSPSPGFTRDNRPVLSYTVSDSSAITSVTVMVDGSVVNKASGSRLDPLLDGSHTVRVEAVDAAGNPGFSEIAFTVDTIPPAVGITSPSAGYINTSTPLLNYTVSDGNVVVKVDGIIVSTVSGQALSPLPDGSHKVRVESTDAAGNTGSDEVNFVIDTVPPAIVITSPLGAINNNTPQLAYTASDISSTTVVVKVDDVVVQKTSGDNLDPLADGEHKVRVDVTDAAGNYGFGEKLFTVDTAPPSGLGYTQISSGYGHTMMLRADGTVWAVGENGYGQLGDGTTTSRSFPVRINAPNEPDTHWLAVSAGWQHTLAIKSDGTLWAWGYNGYGQSGRDTATYNNWTTPYKIDGGQWTMVAAAEYHSLAVNSSGSLYAWGDNTYGQLGDGTTTRTNVVQPVTGITGTVVAAAGGMYHSLALTSDGKLYTWGRDNVGQLGQNEPNPLIPNLVEHPTPQTAWSRIAAGGNHSLAIDTSGKLYAWGYNVSGQIGNGNKTNQHTPQLITVQTPEGEATWSRIAGGMYHSVAMQPNGTLWAWGSTDQTHGVSAEPTQTTPAQLGSDTDWIDISAGHYHSTALKADGTFWAWGNNAYGVSGRTSPTPVAGGGTWVQIAAGQRHSIGIKADGTLWAWGFDNAGQLGNDDLLVNSSTPVSVKTNNTPETSWTAVAAGGLHSLAIGANGTLWAWGNNNYGQAGDGTSSNNRTTPVQVGSGSQELLGKTWEAVAAGVHHSVGLTSTGELYAWGYNPQGQVGNGTTTHQYTPVKIDANIMPDDSGRTWTKIAAGAAFTLAIRNDNTLWAWGHNHLGQLGDGTTTQKTSPVQVAPEGLPPDLPSTWSEVSCGSNHCIAIHTDGTLWSWGSNGYSQLGSGVSRSTPEKIDDTLSFTNNNWSHIYAGQWYSFGLKSTGELYGWGSNSYGQLGDGTTTKQSQPTQIAVGTSWAVLATQNFHTMAIKSDGTLWSWGYDAYGQLGDGAPVDRSSPRQVETVLVINNGEWSTTNSSVTLTLSAANTADIQAMEICNSGANCSTIEPYTTTVPWTLEAGTGERTVTVRFRDTAGNLSSMYQDTIVVLDAAGP